MFRGFQRFRKFRNIQNIRKLSIKKELFMPVFPMNLSIASCDNKAASSLQNYLFILLRKKEGKKIASYPIVSPDSYCYM